VNRLGVGGGGGGGCCMEEAEIGIFLDIYIYIYIINSIYFFWLKICQIFDITKLKIKPSLKGTQKKCHIRINFNSQNLTFDYLLPLI